MWPVRLNLQTAAPIWRVLPIGEHLVVGIGGACEDPNRILRTCEPGTMTRVGSELGATIVLDHEGRARRFDGVTPIAPVDDGFLSLGEDGLSVRAFDGRITGRLQLDSRPDLVVRVGSASVLATELDGCCTCRVIDHRLQEIGRFDVPQLSPVTCTPDGIVWIDAGARVRVVTLDGVSTPLCCLGDPEVRNEVGSWMSTMDGARDWRSDWAREATAGWPNGNRGWAISFDPGRDELIATHFYPPQTAICMTNQGEIRWVRCYSTACCGSAAHRIGEHLVANTGCGGTVVWLNDDGSIHAESKDLTREHGVTDGLWPSIVPGPGTTVLACRFGRLVQFSPDGTEEIVFRNTEDSFFDMAWSDPRNLTVCWTRSALWCLECCEGTQR